MFESRAPFIAAGGPFGIIDHGVDRPALWSVQALNRIKIAEVSAIAKAM
jgi:hypothetical protein